MSKEVAVDVRGSETGADGAATAMDYSFLSMTLNRLTVSSGRILVEFEDIRTTSSSARSYLDPCNSTVSAHSRQDSRESQDRTNRYGWPDRFHKSFVTLTHDSSCLFSKHRKHGREQNHVPWQGRKHGNGGQFRKTLRRQKLRKHQNTQTRHDQTTRQHNRPPTG